MRPINEPPLIEADVEKVTIKIRKDEKYEDGKLEIKLKDGAIFLGVLVKDMYRTKEWHKILKAKKEIYLAMYGGTAPFRIALWYQNRWNTIWDRGNDFQSFAEEKKSSDKYMNFIKKEGERIANMIDTGLTYEQINKKVSKEHSGNTYAWALHMGIRKAKNKKNAEKVRKTHNLEYGVKNGKGTVNPAILRIGVKK